MLDFAKIVLNGVSFDRFLFSKELGKIIKWSDCNDIEEIKNWCDTTYGSLYKDIIRKCFELISNQSQSVITCENVNK